MSKKTLILGASSNPSRYSYQAALKLTNSGHEIYCFGKQRGYMPFKQTKPQSVKTFVKTIISGKLLMM